MKSFISALVALATISTSVSAHPATDASQDKDFIPFPSVFYSDILNIHINGDKYEPVNAAYGNFFVGGQATTKKCDKSQDSVCINGQTNFYAPTNGSLNLHSTPYNYKIGITHHLIEGQPVFLDSKGAMTYLPRGAKGAPKGSFVTGWEFSYGTIAFRTKKGNLPAYLCPVGDPEQGVAQIYFPVVSLSKNCTQAQFTPVSLYSAIEYEVTQS